MKRFREKKHGGKNYQEKIKNKKRNSQDIKTLKHEEIFLLFDEASNKYKHYNMSNDIKCTDF